MKKLGMELKGLNGRIERLEKMDRMASDMADINDMKKMMSDLDKKIAAMEKFLSKEA